MATSAKKNHSFTPLKTKYNIPCGQDNVKKDEKKSRPFDFVCVITDNSIVDYSESIPSINCFASLADLPPRSRAKRSARSSSSFVGRYIPFSFAK